MNSKIIILSAPSGSGKTSIAENILNDKELNCKFSISATSRKPRGEEKDKVHYYFLDPEIFKQYIQNEMFIEWEEVYKDQYYGTLKQEIERISNQGFNILFDVDVKGGIKLKEIFADKAISIFIMPPSVEELENRLKNRKTETPESINKRIQRAEEELAHAPMFDQIVINDVLENAIAETKKIIKHFIEI